MSANGKRRPPRPRIEIVAGSPPPEEAAAVVAAIERFLADQAPTAPPTTPLSRWQRTALLEGVRAKEGLVSPWGQPRGWTR